MSWMVDFNIQKNDGADSDHDHDELESSTRLQPWTKQTTMLQKSENTNKTYDLVGEASFVGTYKEPADDGLLFLGLFIGLLVLIVDYRLIFPSELGSY
ncbi:hypothetical protein L1987_13029 [Smallanthus sonchifolius]|uniref:Uncharacterized protein n=1 Tax=Smallanthus sonchifolius TaxID=185202 RepID=A0ACB9JFF4_9ASTR|nr:hypothetical protein L1987_13029 [Smallanthus sonchifolius]